MKLHIYKKYHHHDEPDSGDSYTTITNCVVLLRFSTALLTSKHTNDKPRLCLVQRQKSRSCLWLNSAIVGNWWKSPINRLQAPTLSNSRQVSPKSSNAIIKQAPQQQWHLRNQGKDFFHKASPPTKTPTVQALWWQWFLVPEDLIAKNQQLLEW